jgi:SSS family solute:Na+ symporter
MYVYLQSVQAYISPPIAACFLFGIFWKRVNGKGAVASLFTGLVVGAFRLIIEIQNKMEPLTNEVLKYIATINFLHFAIFLFILTSGVLVFVSLATEKPDEKKLIGFVYDKAALYEKSRWRSVNIFLSVLLVLTLLTLWYIFR